MLPFKSFSNELKFMKVGVLLDHNVPLDYFIKGNFAEFFRYLESHHGLGVMASKPYGDIRKIIRKNTYGESYRSAMDEYNRMPLYVEIQAPNFSIFENNLADVRKFLFKLISEKMNPLQINIGTVSSRYRYLANDINQQNLSLSLEERQNLKQKLFWEPPESEDVKLIIEAWKLPREHKFIASKDRHFIEPTISKAIEDNYGVKCMHPSNLLPEIRKYEPF
jgi:hypothetical protein